MWKIVKKSGRIHMSLYVPFEKQVIGNIELWFHGDRETIKWEDQEYNKNVSAFYKKSFLFQRQQGKELSG